MTNTTDQTLQFALCLDNEGYPASLEVGKLYRVVPDEEAVAHGYVRIIDESGEDYAFTANRFHQDRLGHANIQNTMVYMRYTPRHPRCPDTAAVCQSSYGLNRPWRPSSPQVLALSGTLTHRLSLIEKVSYPAASTRRPRALVRARR
jgi:hypothetical protein